MTEQREQAPAPRGDGAAADEAGSDALSQAGSLLHAARQAYDRHAYDEASKVLQQAVRLDPDLGSAWGLLGEVLVATGDCDVAIEALTRAIEVSPARQSAYLRARGFCHVVLGTYGPAIRDLREALEAGEAASTLRWRAVAHLHLGRGYEALADVERAIEIEPRYFCGHTIRAVVLRSLGRLEEAEEQVHACQVFPVHEAEEFFCLAELYASLGRHDDASAHLHTALAREPALLARVRHNPLFGLFYSPGTGEPDLDTLLG